MEINNNKVPLRVLTISSYGSALAVKSNNVFSGAAQRQIDYAKFLESYIIISPSKNSIENEMNFVSLKNNLRIYQVATISQIQFLWKAYFLAKKVIKKENINCINCDNPFISAIIGVMLKWKYKMPLVVHSMADMLDNPYYLKERRANYLKNIIFKIICRYLDLLRVSTITEVEKMGIDEKKIVYAPFYIDFKIFENVETDVEFRKRLLKDKYDRIITFIGRVAKQKDLQTFIKSVSDVISEFPKTLFLLIGDGPEFDKINKLVKDLKIENNVLLLGSVKYEDINQYFKASDIFCATSIYEGTCMTLHEAAISRLPIVATKFAGAIDMIKNDENGYLVDIGDSNAVAEKLKILLGNPDLCKKMGMNNYERVKKYFNRELALNKYRQIFIRANEM